MTSVKETTTRLLSGAFCNSEETEAFGVEAFGNHPTYSSYLDQMTHGDGVTGRPARATSDARGPLNSKGRAAFFGIKDVGNGLHFAPVGGDHG